MGREPRMVGSGVLPPLHSRHIWSSQLGLVHAILSCACLTMVTRALVYGKWRARGTNVGIMR